MGMEAWDPAGGFTTPEPVRTCSRIMRRNQSCASRAVALLVIGFAACDGLGPEDVAGTYTLQSINGDPLPWIYYQVADVSIGITAGSMALNRDRTCSEGQTITETAAGVADHHVSTRECTYTLNGDAITVTFPSDGGASVSGSIVGSQLTLTIGGRIFVFRR